MILDKTKTPDDIYAALPEEEFVTAQLLRDLIFELVPEAHEKLSWGAPFYFRKRSFAFVWPASVPWGKLEAGVALGFPRATEIAHGGLLGTATVGRLVYHRAEEIDLVVATDLILQSADAARR